MPLTALFSAEQLTRQLQYGPDDSIDEADAAQTWVIVAGWLSEATELETWPNPIPPELTSWAIELGGIAFENPTSMESDEAGDVRSAWRDRRSQILAQVRAWAVRKGYATDQAAPARSRGCFPKAVPLPDPAVPARGW